MDEEFRRGYPTFLVWKLLRSALEVGPRIRARYALLDRQHRETARIETRSDRDPGERRRDRRAGATAHRVRRAVKLQVRVAEGIRVHARAASLLAELHR